MIVDSTNFNKAIVMTGRSGFSQDEALANELLASYLMSDGDFAKASDYVTRAHELYQAWGAHGKVKHLEAKYVLIKGPGDGGMGGGMGARRRRSSGTSHLARQRFSQTNSDSHKTIDLSSAFSALSDGDDNGSRSPGQIDDPFGSSSAPSPKKRTSILWPQ